MELIDKDGFCLGTFHLMSLCFTNIPRPANVWKARPSGVAHPVPNWTNRKHACGERSLVNVSSWRSSPITKARYQPSFGNVFPLAPGKATALLLSALHPWLMTRTMPQNSQWACIYFRKQNATKLRCSPQECALSKKSLSNDNKIKSWKCQCEKCNWLLAIEELIMMKHGPQKCSFCFATKPWNLGLLPCSERYPDEGLYKAFLVIIHLSIVTYVKHMFN